MKRDTTFGLDWVSVGPVVNSARVESVQLDPANPGTIYAAFGSGNLWKTINNGVTWRPIFEDQASHGIGDIAIAPSNPDVIYLGTGESLKKARNFTIPGTGVYRSDDAGETWRHLGLSDSWHIGEIAVHPTNPDIALVAVLGHFWSSNPHRGLYRTEDGGETWNHVLRIDGQTGANDVVWAKDNPDVVYASTWENYPDVCGVNSGVHKSSDGGVTWQKCLQGLPQGSKVGRIGLAVSQTDSKKVYALIDNREGIDSNGSIRTEAAQVFKSLDGGKSWNKSHKSDLKFFSRIGWYFADIYVNPQDDEEIFALGVRVAHSTDGGQTFEYVAGKVSHVNPSAASGLHLDHCEMWIHPTNPKHIVLASDGGLYQSFDKGESWTHFNNLPTGEFYDLAIEQSDPYRIYAGAQDDATVFGPPLEFDPSQADPWRYLWIDPWNGGDGCITQVDPDDPNTVYFSAQEGAFRRKDMTTNRAVGIRPGLPKGHSGKLEFNFIAPMIISPHDSQQIFIAGNHVFGSANRGDQWEVISPDLSKPRDEDRRSVAVSAIAESPIVRGVLLAGTDRGAFWVSEDMGGEWEERSNQFPVGYVRSIVPSRFQSMRVYATVSGLNYDDLNSHVVCSEDRGITWKSISANLPNEPANVIMEDPTHENILYLGSFRGVYVSIDRGQSWMMLGGNLPACSVADLEFHESTSELLIATHGRGIYRLNLAPFYQRYMSPIKAGGSIQLLNVPTATRPYLSNVRPGLNFRPLSKTPISFWLKDSGEVTLSVIGVEGEPAGSDEENVVVKSPLFQCVIDGRRGLNQFRWDLVLKTQKSDAPYFINEREYLNPGSYRVRVETKAGASMEQPFSVVDATTKNQ